MSELSQILVRAGQGDAVAVAEILPLVYAKLKRMAEEQMAEERPGQTLTATGLVHEAYLRLGIDGGLGSWNSRAHFFSAAGEAMRRVLIEIARRKKALRHGGDWKRIPMDPDVALTNRKSDRLLALDEALENLGKEKP